ncbi:MAG: hypothetical protein JRJ39_17470 [Deltaproteobacteria bacterium]|nr:hypothetical protein [Deltaproteobacteria bacterium]
MTENDLRFGIAPAGEKADNTILINAWELLNKEPNYPPIIISNDKFEDYFEEHPELLALDKRKIGVFWGFRQKKKEPIINLLDLQS